MWIAVYFIGALLLAVTPSYVAEQERQYPWILFMILTWPLTAVPFFLWLWYCRSIPHNGTCETAPSASPSTKIVARCEYLKNNPAKVRVAMKEAGLLTQDQIWMIEAEEEVEAYLRDEK